ncbi:MAG TPA: hypothetical protein GXX20_02845 [Clostridiaceae bacterium]|nr:hypothetical protein [Clostridiaceae bacterium]
MKLVFNKIFFKKIIPAVILIIAITVSAAGMITGCAARDNQKETGTNIEDSTDNSSEKQNTIENNDNEQDDKENKIMEEYRGLFSGNFSIKEIVEFIDKNISLVSDENATLMVDEFEKMQKEYLSELEEKYNNATIQEELGKKYLSDFDISKINKIDGIENVGLRELLTETLESGYKVETAEGMFFPVINYEFYKKYSDYVTSDIKEYIDIMAIESSNPPAKDAALVISWEEILNRALTQEKFIIKNESSIRIQDIKNLYNKYMTFTLFGLNNTPLFTYDTKAMDPEAKEVYLRAVEKVEESNFLKTLKEYVELLKKNNYKLTDEVEQFRKGIL